MDEGVVDARGWETEVVSFGPDSVYQLIIGDDAGTTPIRTGIQTAQPSYVAPVNSHPYLEILHILDGAAEAWMDGQEDRKELPGRRRGCAAASRHLRLAEAHRGLPGPQVGRPWLSGLMRCR